MASKTTLFNQVKEMNNLIASPRWIIGFKYFMLDDEDSIKLDLGALMLHFGYTEEYTLCSSYYEKHPDSIAMPMSDGIDRFFQHLKDVGIFKKDTPIGSLEQTPQTKSIYEEISSSLFNVNSSVCIMHNH